MKKSIVALIIIVLAACFGLSGCNNKTEKGYEYYFNSFVSNKGFSAVAESLVLDEGVFVNSYDNHADIYIIYQIIKVGNNDVEIYGFATEDSVIMPPRYVRVLDVRYSYAIVVKSVGVGSQAYQTVGVVCIRGDKVGKEYGFSYQYSSTSVQYTFLNDDYLVMFGDKDYKEGAFNFATVYDYTSANGLLEVGRIGNTTLATMFSLNDNYIAAVGKSVVRYYYFDQIDQNGFFRMSEGGAFTPFKEADGFTDMSLVSTSVYYLGNGWFVETGVYTSTQQFTGYEQTRKGANNLTYYYVNRSTRYNVRSGKRFDTDRVTLVANKYSAHYINTITNALNAEVNISQDDKLPMYYQPIVPVSEMINQEYSIVYYDFEYYDYRDQLAWGQSFTIYDKNADILNLKDLLMPLLFVDGIGLQNSDPVYDILGRDFGYHKMDGSFVTLKSVGDTRLLYDPVIVNDGMIIGYRANLNPGDEMLTSMLGAFSADGQYQIPFEYVELTMFVNGYATGSKFVKTNDNKTVREFYRISKSGVITKLENVFSLKNGMYITKEGDKFGLFANDGMRLLDAEYTNLSIIENYLTKDGLYFNSRVVGVRDKRGVIFKVSNIA